MKDYTIKQYHNSDYANWNTFVGQAKNATFLFHRDFMGYHKDRFEDFSLLVFDDKKVVAILPANRVDNEVFSHQGLSYGGLVVENSIRIKDYLIIFRNILLYLNQQNILNLYLKLLPKIYNKTISDEIDYAAFLTQALVYRSDVYLAIDNNLDYNPNRNRKRALKIAIENGIEVKEETNYENFWNQILIPNLNIRFGVTPVHTLKEITAISLLFPNEIKLYNAYYQDQLKAGVILFLTDKVAHFQYSSGSEDRIETAALDVLFDFIIRKYSDKNFISFGSSSENEGRVLNEGLVYWKESFGAVASVQNYIKIEPKNYLLLNQLTL